MPSRRAPSRTLMAAFQLDGPGDDWSTQREGPRAGGQRPRGRASHASASLLQTCEGPGRQLPGDRRAARARHVTMSPVPRSRCGAPTSRAPQALRCTAFTPMARSPEPSCISATVVRGWRPRRPCVPGTPDGRRHGARGSRVGTPIAGRDGSITCLEPSHGCDDHSMRMSPRRRGRGGWQGTPSAARGRSERAGPARSSGIASETATAARRTRTVVTAAFRPLGDR